MLSENISQTPFGKDNLEGKKEIIILVGIPASGKSTYIEKKLKPLFENDLFIVNRDDIVDMIAEKHGLTYDDMFTKAPKGANDEIDSLLQNKLMAASVSGKNIVIDMTNMNSYIRKRNLRIAPKDYFKRAVVFNVTESQLPIVYKRSANRSKELEKIGKKKTIGEFVFKKMISKFEPITADEGFDKVDVVNL
jgi:predicted kinase